MIENRKTGWYSVPEICEFLSVGERWLRRILQQVPRKYVDTTSRTHYYQGRAVVDAWRPQSSTGEEDMLAGPAGENLEKYRFEAWLLKRMERQEKEGKLLPADSLHHILSRFAALTLEAKRELRVSYGNDAAEILDRAIDGFGDELEDLLEGITTDGNAVDTEQDEGDQGSDSVLSGEREGAEETADS